MVVEYSISLDDDDPISFRTDSTEGIESETACKNIANNGCFVRLAVCVWIFNLNIRGLMIPHKQQKQKRIKFVAR